jgi:Ca2+-binding EF-hand superfamily protein
MSFQDFEKAMTMMTLDATPDETKRLFNEFQSNSFVIVADFIRVLQGQREKTPKETVEEISHYFKVGNKSLRDVFNPDRDGWVYRVELSKALNACNVVVTPNEMFELICYLNPQQDRTDQRNATNQRFNIRELEQLVASRNDTISDARVEMEIKKGYYRQIAEFVTNHRVNLENDYFKRWDRNVTGSISSDNFI